MTDEIQGNEAEQDEPTQPSLLVRHKGLVAGAAAVLVLGGGTAIALTSSSSSTKHAGTNSLPGATAGAPAAASDDGVDTFVNFQLYGGSSYLPTESTSGVSNKDYPVTEVNDATTNVEQTLNIGSQSTGAGAGKITFNDLTMTLPIDVNTPTLFKMAASGQPFQQVTVYEVKPNGNGSGAKAPLNTDQTVQLVYTFKLAAIKTITFHGSSVDVAFQYGGMQVTYRQRKPDGSLSAPTTMGWNRVRNVVDNSTVPIQ